MEQAQARPTGMRAFIVVWLGQVVSLLGSGMTQFAITFWAFEVTGEATALALVGVATFGPTVLLSPVAGTIVDRVSRKWVMIASDLAAGLATIVILALSLAGRLEIWHLYVTGAFAGAFGAFQFPAYSAAVTLMLPKDQYARASGMLSLAQSISGIAAPVLAAVLLGLSGLNGVLTVDIVTFVFAVGTLVVVHIPDPAPEDRDDEGRGSFVHETLYGFRYILARPSLLGLQAVFFGINFSATFAMILMAPMILARTGNDEVVLGSAQSALGAGGVVGGLLLSTWGGPRRKVNGVLLGMAGASLLGQVTMGVAQGPVVWMAGGFLLAFFLPLINGSNQAIWQAKVLPSVQGRVFAVRRLLAQLSAPLAMLMAGPLADQVFEPAMASGGALAGALGPLVGTGAGAGMGLMFVLSGLVGTTFALAAYLVPAVREAETRLPDHDAVGEGGPAGGDGDIEARGHDRDVALTGGPRAAPTASPAAASAVSRDRGPMAKPIPVPFPVHRVDEEAAEFVLSREEQPGNHAGPDGRTSQTAVGIVVDDRRRLSSTSR